MPEVGKKENKFFVSTIKSFDEENKTVEATVSDETIDRYGEVILSSAWKKRLNNYLKHGPLLSSHNYGKLTNQIGRIEKLRVKDGALVAKFKYFANEGNEEADWAWKLVSKFGVAAYSVGFIPFDWDEGEYDEDTKKGKKASRIFKDVELVEVSQVTVPANPSALARSLEDPQVDEITRDFYKKTMEDAIQKMRIEEKVAGIKCPKCGSTNCTAECECDDCGAEWEMGEEEEKGLGDVIETKPETTENFHHIPIKSKSQFIKESFRTISISEKEGIKAVIGKLKSDPEGSTTVQKFLFDVDKWTMEEAKKWVADHKKSFEEVDMDEIIKAVKETIEASIKSVFDEFKKDVDAKLDGFETRVAELVDVLVEKSIEPNIEIKEVLTDEEKAVKEAEEKAVKEAEEKAALDAAQKQDEEYIVRVLTEANDRLKGLVSAQS